MEKLCELMTIYASERFDKQVLLQLHELARQQLGNMPQGFFLARFSFTDPIGSSGGGSSVPLEKLKPISFTQLQVGRVHRGRVLYGTICAEAFRISGIMTMLEDDHGLGVRLAIYNAAHSQNNIQRLYPRGAKVAIREPYFKRAADGGLSIRVDNPANVEMIVTHEDQKPAQSLPHVDVEELRKKGNSCFRERQWDAAAEYYTECIEAALLQLKKGSSSDNNNINTSLLHAYSNRTETRLRVKEFELALEDSDKVLAMDPGNLKALYRKGRALVGLKQYAAACEYLDKANEASPGRFEIQEIQDAFRQAKTLYSQSRNGKYDISDYLLGRASSPPEVADFIGPVEIKMTKDGRGRGLYAKREITTGQLLLVSNAVAVAYDNDSAGINVDHRGNINLPSQDLVAAVVSAARKSQRLLQQLYSLDYSARRNLDVPAIDLFKTEGQIAARKEKLQVEVNRIRDIISRNSVGGGELTYASISEAKLVQRGQNFSGLWLLPSFINHSCLPNSSRLQVGSAMFIHACKPIKRGKEITISYFDTLVPLPQRQAMCERWGFKCKCRRCILELSLKAALEAINQRFEELHYKALEEINDARSPEGFDTDLPACAEFAKLFVEAEEIIRSSALLKTEEERNWIRASFVSAYPAGTQLDDFFPTTLKECIPSSEEVVKAIQNAVPGDIRTLVMVAQQLQGAKRWFGEESLSSEQAREACIRVFGRHSEDVLKALVLQHSDYLF